jgi:hypothetical protein
VFYKVKYYSSSHTPGSRLLQNCAVCCALCARASALHLVGSRPGGGSYVRSTNNSLFFGAGAPSPGAGPGARSGACSWRIIRPFRPTPRLFLDSDSSSSPSSFLIRKPLPQPQQPPQG